MNATSPCFHDPTLRPQLKSSVYLAHLYNRASTPALLQEMSSHNRHSPGDPILVARSQKSFRPTTNKNKSPFTRMVAEDL